MTPFHIRDRIDLFVCHALWRRGHMLFLHTDHYFVESCEAAVIPGELVGQFLILDPDINEATPEEVSEKTGIPVNYARTMLGIMKARPSLLDQLLNLCGISDPHLVEQAILDNPPDLPEIDDTKLAEMLEVTEKEAKLIRRILNTSESDRERLTQVIKEQRLTPQVARLLATNLNPGVPKIMVTRVAKLITEIMSIPDNEDDQD